MYVSLYSPFIDCKIKISSHFQSCHSGGDGCANYKVLNDSSRYSNYGSPPNLVDRTSSIKSPDWEGPSWYRLVMMLLSLPFGEPSQAEL